MAQLKDSTQAERLLCSSPLTIPSSTQQHIPKQELPENLNTAWKTLHDTVT